MTQILVELAKVFFNIPLPFLLLNIVAQHNVDIVVWQQIQMSHFVLIIGSFLIFQFRSLVIHHWSKFLKEVLFITFENSSWYHKCFFLFLSFGFTFFNSRKFCCKKAWWYISDYTPSSKILLQFFYGQPYTLLLFSIL